jgi:hypothetical protein
MKRTKNVPRCQGIDQLVPSSLVQSWQLGPGTVTSIAGASVRAHHRGGRREVGIMHLQCGLLGAREHCTHY